jgi:hypothetical protein
MNHSSRRLRRVPISYVLLGKLLAEGQSFRVLSGLPADAQIVAMLDFKVDQQVHLVVRSSQFEAIPRGRFIPELPMPVIQEVVANAGAVR